MSAHATPAKPVEQPTRVSPLELILVVSVLAVAGLLSKWIPYSMHVGVAAVVGALAPRGRATSTRLTIATICGLTALFVMKNWVGDDTAPPEEAPVESGTLLSWLIGIPMLGALAILFVPRQAHKILKGLSLVLMLATLFASLALLSVPMGQGFHFNQDIVWLERFGIHYHVAIDGTSIWMVILTTFIMPIATFASYGSIETRIKDWCFALLLLEAALIGAFVSLDLFLFYIFFELCLVPMYVMIGVWGSTNRIKSALKFFIYTMVGSVLLLAALLYVSYTYEQISGGTPSFDYFELQRVLFPQQTQIILWVAFTIAFIIKVPMFPVHTWLPDAHTEAPTGGSVILAAVMLKLGTYGYLRFCMGLFPEACSQFASNLAGLAVLGGILYGALCAWKQDDVKRLVAYSSVAHLGYVMLGIAACTASALQGSVLQMVNHGISTGALFMLVGVIYDRRHTRMADEYGGIAKVMPIYATFFIIATLASVGLPGTNGFIGEFMVITGTFVSNKLGQLNGIQAVGAAVGVIFGALYMLSVVQKVFFGKITKKENKNLKDLNDRELIALVPLTLFIFVIGFFPNIFLAPIKGATDRIQADYEARVAAHPPPLFYNGPVRLLPRKKEATPPVMVAAPIANAEKK